MNNPDRFLQIQMPDHKDSEPFESFTVTRSRITGANRFGKPIADPQETRSFQQASDALRWSLESPGHMHSFKFPLPSLKLSARLSGVPLSSTEQLIISTPDQIGISARSVEGHHAVSTDYSSFFRLIIDLEPDQLSLFDRGVVWLSLDPDEPGSLLFNINPGIHTLDELETGIAQMLKRVHQVGNDLLQSGKTN